MNPDLTDQTPMEDDSSLVQSALTGDTDAFEHLLERHLQHIRTFLALRAPVAHLVDELAHETFVFAFGRLADFRPGSSLRAWLRAIAWNLLRAEIQRYAREDSHKTRFAEAQFWEHAAAQSDPLARPELDFLEECLKAVPPTSRELLHLKYRLEYSTDQISEHVQRGSEWVRVVLYRLRQQLRECIEKKQQEDSPC